MSELLQDQETEEYNTAMQEQAMAEADEAETEEDQQEDQERQKEITSYLKKFHFKNSRDAVEQAVEKQGVKAFCQKTVWENPKAFEYYEKRFANEPEDDFWEQCLIDALQ